MQFIFHKEAKNSLITVTGESYNHLFKSRRQKKEEFLHVRNMEDDFLYLYKVLHVDRKSATLELISSQKSELKSASHLTLGWCVIDPKSIEKTLPTLNEIGVHHIAFVYSEYSQKNYQIDMKKLTKIAINSCEQCGRSALMKFSIFQSVEAYLEHFPHSYILDFNGQAIGKKRAIEAVLIGCEGGFSESERELFNKDNIIKFNSPLILKSQSAACAISAKILL